MRIDFGNLSMGVLGASAPSESTPHGHMPSAGQERQCATRRSLLFLGEQRAANSVSLEHIALHVLGQSLGRRTLAAQQGAEQVAARTGRLPGGSGIRHVFGEPPKMRQAHGRQRCGGGYTAQDRFRHSKLDAALDGTQLTVRHEQPFCGADQRSIAPAFGRASRERAGCPIHERCQRQADIPLGRHPRVEPQMWLAEAPCGGKRFARLGMGGQLVLILAEEFIEGIVDTGAEEALFHPGVSDGLGRRLLGVRASVPPLTQGCKACLQRIGIRRPIVIDQARDPVTEAGDEEPLLVLEEKSDQLGPQRPHAACRQCRTIVRKACREAVTCRGREDPQPPWRDDSLKTLARERQYLGALGRQNEILLVQDEKDGPACFGERAQRPYLILGERTIEPRDEDHGVRFRKV